MENGLEVPLAPEALGVDLVNVLCAGRPRRKPSAGRHYLQPADRSIITRCRRQLRDNRLTGEVVVLDSIGRQLLEPGFLLRRCCHINARVMRRTEFGGELGVMLSPPS